MKTIAVIGAGTMGAGIAQLAAKYGCEVHLIDVNADLVKRAVESITKRLDRSVEKGKLSTDERDAIAGRISPSDTITGLGNVELAIEAVVENLDVKHKVFKQLEAETPATAILATNTSSLSVTKIAAALSDPARVIGMHFFNPAPVMPLVEIIAGEASDTAHIDAAYDVAGAWGKTPVRAKDTPGFIVNRVARGFYLEALRLLDEGVGSVYEIDSVMKTHGKFRMGPFELMDLVGLDVNFSVSTSVWQQMDKPERLTPHAIQEKLVSDGHLGRKTGRGFYVYEDGGVMPAHTVDRQSFELSPLTANAILAFSYKAGASEANSTEQYIFTRILAAIINEAGIAYGQGVASSDDIDIAMTKGTNYPKGPLEWADEIGHRNVRGALKALGEVAPGRYDAAALFEE